MCESVMGDGYPLGKGPATKSNELLGKFQTAFDPPSFSENYVAIFFMTDMAANTRGGMMAR